jgi:hypothetical protein
MRQLVASAAIVAAIISTPARSEPTLDQFLQMEDTAPGRKLNENYIAGIITGFLWYSTGLHVRGQAELYCQPSKMAVTPDQAVNMLRQYRQQHPTRSTLTVGQALILSFEEVF